MKPVPIIGLSGGIASGKSTVADVLEELGCFVSDSDLLAHEVLLEPAVVAEVTARWGEGVLDGGGAVSRSVVAQRIFADAEERLWLEGLVHPRVNDRRRRAISAVIESRDVPACVIDAPLLFEAGVDRECTTTIFVDAPRALRLDRAMSGRGWDEAEFERRERAQLDLAEKASRSEHVIVNDSDPKALRSRTGEVFRSIIG